MNEELKIIISAEIEKLKSELNKGKEELKGFEKQGESTGSKVGKAMAATGKAVGAAAKAIAAGVIAAGAAMVGVVESTREYRTEQAKLITAFESAGSSAEQAKQTYNDLYRVLGDSGVATEAAGHLAKLTTNQESLAEYTKICQGVYATFGDSLPIESLTEAINETAKTGEVTGALADAINWAGMSEDEFAEQLFWCNSEAEREALIRDTLNGLYSEAAENYEQNAASILDANAAQAAMTEALAQLGAALEPVVTILKGGLAEALTELLPSVQMIAEGLTDMATGAEGGAAKIEEGITTLLTGVINKIVELLPTLLTVGVQIITALISGITEALPQILDAIIGIIPVILQALTDLIPQVTGALLGALPKIIDALVEIAAGVILALADILPKILKQIVSILPKVIKSLIDAIPKLLDAAITFLMAIVEAIPEVIPPLIEALPGLIDALLDELLDNLPVLLDASITLFNALVDAIPAIIPPLVKAIPDIIDSIIDALIQATPIILAAAVKAFAAIVQAIPKILPDLLKGAADIVRNIKTNLVEKLKSALKFDWKLPNIKMPSITVEWKNSPDWLAEAAKFIGLKGIPSFKVNWNALGGVFDKPTIFSYGDSLQGIGENGAEAVVPLENNTEWLDKIAARLSSAMGGSSQPIILQVDGKTFAQTSINSINQLTKQTGKLPLVLV